MLFETGSRSTIRDLWVAVGQLYQTSTGMEYFDGLTPLHVAAYLAAGTDQLKVFQSIYEKTLENKNPGQTYGKIDGLIR